MVYEVLCWGVTSTHGHFMGAYQDRAEALRKADELTGKRLRNRRAEVWAVSHDRQRVFVSEPQGSWFDVHVRPRLRPSGLAERLSGAAA